MPFAVDLSFVKYVLRNGTLWLSASCILVFAAGCGTETKSPETQQPTETDRDGADVDSIKEDATAEESGPRDENGKPAKDDQSQVKPESAPDTAQGSAAADAELWQASAEGALAATREALEEGANVHARNDDGNTALMLAAFFGHEDVVKLLLEHGAEVNARNPEGRTPLMFAATFDSPDTVELLLADGAAVDVRDNQEKFTALMFAASEGHLDAVKLLLDHDADKTLVDVDGDTAADFARRNGHEKVAEFLE